jgi:hypothetical protein
MRRNLMPISWHSYVGRLSMPTPKYDAAWGPSYPERSACWFCGTEVDGSPMMALRCCRDNGHEEVRWNERLPGVAYEPRPDYNQVTIFTSCP